MNAKISIIFAVLLSVPCGLMGSFLFAWLFGLENNIYMQTGLIMIIGLLAQTAILLTEMCMRDREIVAKYKTDDSPYLLPIAKGEGAIFWSPVSYTHLDVYKRQAGHPSLMSIICHLI